jgi:hypothetical protein
MANNADVCMNGPRHSNRELFWQRIEDECPISLNAALWNMDDADLSETMLAKELEHFDYCVYMLFLKIVAECWMVL